MIATPIAGRESRRNDAVSTLGCHNPAVAIEPLLYVSPGSSTLRDRFDDVLNEFLEVRRGEAEAIDPRATVLTDEVIRVVTSGGKRLRPTFCYWGYRATGAPDDDRIVKAAAALELLHTFAVVHDDLIDGAMERRGVPATSPWMQGSARERGVADPAGFGAAAAILVGDLAAVLADQLMLEAGFPPITLARALARYHSMRIEMASGQVLGLLGPAVDEREALLIASMKGGAYTVERPLLIGATLAEGTIEQHAMLSRYGSPLGEAFQLMDDLRDEPGAAPVTSETVARLASGAKRSLDASALEPEAIRHLSALADLVVSS
jgi:geranylgeranyl diphosphate synthase, type I